MITLFLMESRIYGGEIDFFFTEFWYENNADFELFELPEMFGCNWVQL